jgi:Luciferase-like monooxygenase
MKTLILTSEDVRTLPACERVGLVYPWFDEPDVARLAKTAVFAEEAGVRQFWCTQGPVQDTLTALAAAAMHTKDIRLGTAIIPTYTRHPLTMAAGSGTRRPGSGTASARYRLESSAHYRGDIWR